MPPSSHYGIVVDDVTPVNKGVDEVVDESVGMGGPTDVQVNDEAEAATLTENQELIDETFVNDESEEDPILPH